jgi:hypothetical protein
MPTLEQIQTAVNNRLQTLWGPFKTRQEAYRLANGTYAQLLPLSAVPDDGATVAPNASLAPSDRPGCTAAAALNSDLPASLEMQLRCDVYGEPGGAQGYYATSRVSKSGTTYSRTAWVHEGVEQTTGAWTAEV